MSNAKVGHSALDPERIDITENAGVPDILEDRITFLRAAVVHAENQLTLLEDQLDRLAHKAEQVKADWDGKVDNASAMVDDARDEVASWQRALEEVEN